MFRIATLVGLLFALAFAVCAQNNDGDWLSGTWDGTAYQIDNNSTWTMRLTVSDGKYSIDYPSLKCGGEWRIVSMSLETATFKERITYGKDNCVDDGNVVIERLNVNQIVFRHSLPDSIEVIASAILKKKLPERKKAAPSSPQTNAQKADDSELNFLVGTWKVDGKDSYEQWERSGEEGFTGRSFNVKNGLKKISETMEIKTIDGKTCYLATVLDQNDGATVKFSLTSADADEFIFENPDHDFPKKIIYKKVSETELSVRVLGEGGKGFTVNMTKQTRIIYD